MTIFNHLIFIIYIRYNTKETIVRESVMPTSEDVSNIYKTFLELTICPTFDSAYNEINLSKYELSKNQYRREALYAPINGNKTLNLTAVFNLVTHEIEDILHSIEISTSDREKFRFKMYFDGNNASKSIIEYETVYTDTFGRCYSIRPQKHIRELIVTKIDIEFLMNTYIYFGYPGQFMYNTKTKVTKI